MQRIVLLAAATALAPACSKEAPVKQEATASTLSAGQYEASWKVTSLRSVDKSTPATKLKQDDAGTSTGCVAADGSIDPALFAEEGDTCTVANPYVRNGRLSMDLTCKRKGQGGEVRQSVSGTFKADSIDAEVSTTTYLDGYGDYAMTRTVTAKRVGECAPAAETEKAS